jgi:hypothetical protein
MRRYYLPLSEVSELWRAEGCWLSRQEIECRIWAAFWLGAFDDGENSFFGYIPEIGTQHGRFVPLFRDILIGSGDEAFTFGSMTGFKVRRLDADDMEELLLGHPDSKARSNRRLSQAELRRHRKEIDRKLRDFTPVSIHQGPAVQDFIRLARAPWKFYERAQRSDHVGEFVRNAAVRPAGLTQHCRRRGIEIPKFLLASTIDATAAAVSPAPQPKEPQPVNGGDIDAPGAHVGARRGRQRSKPDDQRTRDRILAHVQRAEERWPSRGKLPTGPDGKPSIRQAARLLAIDANIPERYHEGPIREILHGRYSPMKRLGIAAPWTTKSRRNVD